MPALARRPKLQLDVDDVCNELRALQRYRATCLKNRISFENRIIANVACFIGYSSFDDQQERVQKQAEAKKVIKSILNGESHAMEGLVKGAYQGIEAIDEVIDSVEKSMTGLAKTLPVVDWLNEKEQAGFGLKSLAVVVGEAGNLANYPNPAKLWKRMGTAPFESQDKVLSGSTWRSGREGKLSKTEWELFGYSPRRRSVMYVIGECLLKVNKGPYRARYDEAKERASETHPEWTKCDCEGTGKTKRGGTCSRCSGKGKVLLRCHRHGMLLATKLLLKNLWIQWNPDLARL